MMRHGITERGSYMNIKEWNHQANTVEAPPPRFARALTRIAGLKPVEFRRQTIKAGKLGQRMIPVSREENSGEDIFFPVKIVRGTVHPRFGKCFENNCSRDN
jgi:hypothetical protein